MHFFDTHPSSSPRRVPDPLRHPPLFRLFQISHFVLVCVRAAYLQEETRRAHFLSLRAAEAATQKLRGVLELLLPRNMVSAECCPETW